MRRFPSGFLWGAATSAHQVEGGNPHSDWWRFERQPGRIRDGSDTSVACDSWNRYQEDFDLLAGLGLNAYRMSIEWSRIQPAPDRIDHGALDRYRDMLDGLRDRGIRPVVTLLHFTLPAWWADRGGLLRRDEAHLAPFADFVRLVARRLGDRV